MKRIFVLLTVSALGVYLMMVESDRKKAMQKTMKTKKTFTEFAHKAEEL